jgi:hypothetical protein
MLVISIALNAKHGGENDLQGPITFGTLLALLWCVAGHLKKPPEERNQTNESEDEHEGWKRTVGQLI